jgi:hypothetical protein
VKRKKKETLTYLSRERERGKVGEGKEGTGSS